MDEEELPQGWAKCKLNDLASDISYGFTASSTLDPVGPRMLRITDIQDNKVNWDDVPYCLIENNEKQKYLLRDGDLVFARTGATVGKSFLIEGKIPDSVFASYLIRVRVENRSLASFLKYFFNSPDYWQQITDFSVGIGQPNVNGSKLKDLSIVFPPLAEQKRIADKLNDLLARVDACRERLERVPALLKRFRQSVLAAATSGELTAEWRKERLLNDWFHTRFELILSEEKGSIRRGPFGSAIKKSFFVREGYKVYEQQNAIQDDVSLGDYYIDKAKFEELSSFSVQPKDFIVSCAGTIGRIAQVPSGALPGVINQALMRLRTNKDIVDDRFFILLFRSPEFQKKILEETQGSAMQNMASIQVIKAVSIILPGLPEQAEIVRRVNTLYAYADRLETRYRACRAAVERLTPALLAKAFRGELVPQDPSDEPASVLLARIEAERAQPGSRKPPKPPAKTKRAPDEQLAFVVEGNEYRDAGKG